MLKIILVILLLAIFYQAGIEDAYRKIEIRLSEAETKLSESQSLPVFIGKDDIIQTELNADGSLKWVDSDNNTIDDCQAGRFIRENYKSVKIIKIK